MADAARKLIEAGLELSEEDRLDVASALWASVDREPDPRWEAAWVEEIQRRLEDPRPSLDWNDVRARLQDRLRKA